MRMAHDTPKTPTWASGTSAATAIVAALLSLPAAPVHAQLLNQLGGALGSGTGGGALAGLGGGLPSVTQASPGNIGGVLQYCVKNNYLSGSGASSIASKVTGLGGGPGTGDYKAGSSGLLQTGNGQSYGLGGSGLKAQATHKVCDLVLQHAKSLL